VLNQKGGVGKTTSTVNLGAALAERGHRVGLVDLDPQGHLSLHLGVDPATCGPTVYDLLLEPSVELPEVLVSARPNLECIPAAVDLAAAESELADHPDRHAILSRKLGPHLGRWDHLLIDCPPSLGLLTLNALALADEVLVPMQAHYLALQGVGRLLETVALVGQGVNPRLRVAGVILCMHETQSTHGREVVDELKGFFKAARGSGAAWADARVYLPAVRRNIKLAEAPSFGQTILEYAPTCPGAMDYRTLAERFAEEWRRRFDAAPAASLRPSSVPAPPMQRHAAADAPPLVEVSDERPAPASTAPAASVEA
jgi:chromosome partitioning protein